MSGASRFTVIVPCFNESSHISRSLATLNAWFAGAVEILVIDDGSSDDTASQAESFAVGHDNVRVHRLPVNGGKGKALRSAIPLSRTEYVLLMDSDLAYDRDSAQRVLDGLATADMVVGNRRHDLSRYSVPVNLFGFLYRRHLVGLGFNTFVRALLQLGLRDTQCGLKGFRREALKQISESLTADGFAVDVEMLLIARALGLRISDVPVHVTYHSAKSSVKLMRSGASMGSEVLRMAARRALGFYSPSRVAAFAARSALKSAPQSEKETFR